MDTIFAVSTGRPPAALAVIRISGAAAFSTVAEIAGRLPPARTARLRALRDGDGSVLDRAIVVTFPEPASYTGEDVVELHCHGGRAIIAAVERRLAGMAGLRPAKAGEFTRRAMANGRMDLAEAEGLADLLEAESEDQRRAALAAVEGQVSQRVRGWLDELRALRVRIEAELNFADDVGAGLDEDDVRAVLDLVVKSMTATLTAPSVERLRDGIRVVLAGPPNAGKSTLFNLLCEREAAIVSPVAGTTRDRIEAPIIRQGTAYLLIDTAGIVRTDDPIEAAGVLLSQEAVAQADIVLWLGEADPGYSRTIWVQAKADEVGRIELMEGRDLCVSRDDAISVMALWTKISDLAGSLKPQSGDLVLRSRQRQRTINALGLLQRTPADDLVVVADDLRVADGELSGILGYGAAEEMLDHLFGRFCIGK